MKKRLFCLLLCLLMVLPMVFMAGCAGKTTGNTAETTATTSTASGAKAMTLTLYSITDEKTTEEAIQQVQDAINQITEVKFNTHIILRLYPEAEYFSALEEKIAAMEKQKAFDEAEAAAQKVAAKAAKAAGFTTVAETTDAAETTAAATDETILNELGLEKTVFPEEDGNQLDIFLVKGIDNYQEYFKRGVLFALDEELSVNSKILNDYIYPTFLSAAKIEGATYAIPNNHMVGEYEYILINKQLYDKYYFDPANVTIINDLDEFVTTVGTKEKDYVPLLNTSESYIYYPTGSPSLLAGYAAGAAAAGTKAAPSDLFGIGQYKAAESLMINWANAGYINTTGTVENTKFGVAFVKGDYSMLEKYKKDYYVTIYKNAAFTNEEVYNSMYTVGAYTKDVSRCMEIIKDLTASEELRNTFQYGVKNINYEIDDTTGYVNIISDTYVMDPINTGNQFKLWINSSMSESEIALAQNGWELAKQHNLKTAVSPYLGFIIKPEPEPAAAAKDGAAPAADAAAAPDAVQYMSVKDILAGLDALSATYFEKLNSYKSTDVTPVTTADSTAAAGTEVAASGVDAYIDQLAAEIDANEFMIAALDTENPNSPLSQYTAWFDVMYPPVVAPVVVAAPAA